MSLPSIAVLIPHFNNLSALVKTISSLKYSGKLQLIVVDDGSELPPMKKDLNVHITSENVELQLLHLQKNSGIQQALNHGLAYIKEHLKVQFIARIDVGDLLLNNRLDKQVRFLQNNPNVGIVGTSAKFVDELGELKFITSYPEKDNSIRKNMALRCNLLHPTVMFRSTIFDDGAFYPAQYPLAEDYALFIEKMKNTQVANIQEILTQVGYSEKGISLSGRKTQLKSRIRIIYNNYFFSYRSLLGILYTFCMLFLPYSFINSLKKRSI